MVTSRPSPASPDDPVASARPGDAERSREWRRRHVTTCLALSAIVMLAIGVRALGMDRKSLWLDEVYTLALSTGRELDAGLPTQTIIDPAPPRLTGITGAHPIWRVATGSRDVTHPPVYFVLLRLWRELFGVGDVAARSFSAFCSVLAVVLVFDVGRLLAGRASGLWAALLLAVAVPQVAYAQEARNYTIQLVFALIAAGALLRIEQRGTSAGRLLVLAISLFLLVMSHYFAVGAAVALGLYALLQLRGRTRWLTLAAMAGAAVVFLGAWAPHMWQQRHVMVVSAGENPWFFDAEPGRAWRALGDVLLIPARLLHYPTDSAPGPLAYGLALLYALPLLLWRRRPDLRLPVLWLLGTVGVVLMLDVMRSSIHLDYIRYTLVAGPGVYLLIACFARSTPYVRHALPAAAALAAVVALPLEYRDTGNDWREPAAFLREEARPGDVILSSSEGGWGYEAHSQLLFLSHYLGELPGPVVVAPQRPTHDVLEAMRASGRRVWLVTPHGGADPSLLPGARFKTGRSFHGVAELWLAEWPQREAP